MTVAATTQENAVATRDVNSLTIKAFFDQNWVKAAIAAVLPKSLTPERMLKVALLAVNKTPKLGDCQRMSLYEAIVQAAELGLEPNTPLGLAYLIPYGNQVQFQIGYKGLIRLAYNTGEVSSIVPRVVYRDDKFRVRYGVEDTIEHEPKMDGDAGPLVAVYALIRYTDPARRPDFEVMTRAQIDKIRALGAKGGPWGAHYDEMAKKSAIKRLLKRAPLSPEKADILARAIEVEAQHEVDLPDLAPEAVEKKPRADLLADRLAPAKQAAPPIDIPADRVEGGYGPPEAE